MIALTATGAHAFTCNCSVYSSCHQCCHSNPSYVSMFLKINHPIPICLSPRLPFKSSFSISICHITVNCLQLMAVLQVRAVLAAALLSSFTFPVWLWIKVQISKTHCTGAAAGYLVISKNMSRSKFPGCFLCNFICWSVLNWECRHHIYKIVVWKAVELLIAFPNDMIAWYDDVTICWCAIAQSEEGRYYCMCCIWPLYVSVYLMQARWR